LAVSLASGVRGDHLDIDSSATTTAIADAGPRSRSRNRRSLDRSV
jgi:hypothetical protein